MKLSFEDWWEKQRIFTEDGRWCARVAWEEGQAALAASGTEPTREQIAEVVADALRGGWPDPYVAGEACSDAVLALFRSEAKPECLCDSPLLAYNENKCPAHPTKA